MRQIVWAALLVCADATGEEHFADAVRKKLLLEIAGGPASPGLRLAHAAR
jgi:hypothetical protein